MRKLFASIVSFFDDLFHEDYQVRNPMSAEDIAALQLNWGSPPLKPDAKMQPADIAALDEIWGQPQGSFRKKAAAKKVK